MIKRRGVSKYEIEIQFGSYFLVCKIYVGKNYHCTYQLADKLVEQLTDRLQNNPVGIILSYMQGAQ